MVFIPEVFENRIISLKGKVYKKNLHTAKDLKNEITHITASVPRMNFRNYQKTCLLTVRHT
jgi:hypothetical protein